MASKSARRSFQIISVVGVEDGVSDSKLAMTFAFSSQDGLASRTLVDTYIRSIIGLHFSYRTLPITRLLIVAGTGVHVQAIVAL